MKQGEQIIQAQQQDRDRKYEQAEAELGRRIISSQVSSRPRMTS